MLEDEQKNILNFAEKGSCDNQDLLSQLHSKIEELLSKHDEIDDKIISLNPTFYEKELNILLRLYLQLTEDEKLKKSVPQTLFIYATMEQIVEVVQTFSAIFILSYFQKLIPLSPEGIIEEFNRGAFLALGQRDGSLRVQKPQSIKDDKIEFPHGSVKILFYLKQFKNLVFPAAPHFETKKLKPLLTVDEYMRTPLSQVNWGNLSVPLFIVSTQKLFNVVEKTVLINGRKVLECLPVAIYKSGQLTPRNALGNIPAIINFSNIRELENYIDENFRRPRKPIPPFNLILVRDSSTGLHPVIRGKAVNIISLCDVKELFDQEIDVSLAAHKNSGIVARLPVEYCLTVPTTLEKGNQQPEVIEINDTQIENLSNDICTNLKKLRVWGDETAQTLFIFGRLLLSRLLLPSLPWQAEIDSLFSKLVNSVTDNDTIAKELYSSLQKLYSILAEMNETPKQRIMREWIRENGLRKFSLIGSKRDQISLLTTKSRFENLEKKLKINIISYTDDPEDIVFYTKQGLSPLQRMHRFYPPHRRPIYFLYPLECQLQMSVERQLIYLLRKNELDMCSVYKRIGIEYKDPDYHLGHINAANTAPVLEYDFDSEFTDDLIDIFDRTSIPNTVTVFCTIRFQSGFIYCTEEFSVYDSGKRGMCSCSELKAGDKILVEMGDERQRIFQDMVRESNLDEQIREKCPLLKEWPKRLDAYLNRSGMTITTLVEILKDEYGVEVSYPAVRSWREGTIKAPRDRKSLEALACIINDSELLDNAAKIINFANKINSKNQQAGIELKDDISRALQRGEVEYKGKPISQFFQLMEISEIIPGGDVEIPRNQANIFTRSKDSLDTRSNE